MKRLLLFAFLTLVQTNASFGQEFVENILHFWGEIITSSFEVDKNGNFYVSGTFEDSIFFGENWLIPQDSSDSFIAKLGSDGQLVWSKLITGNGSEELFDLEIDEAGSVYILGYFDQTIQIDDIFIEIDLPREAYICKLDSSGNLLWLMRGTDNDENLQFRVLEIDNDGSLYVSGIYSDSSIFQIEVEEYEQEYGWFIARLDSSRNPDWVFTANFISYGGFTSMDYDIDGNLYVSANFRDTLFLGEHTLVSVNDLDACLLKFDANGEIVWVESIIEELNDVSHVSLDNENNVYIIATSGYIAKCNSSSDSLWARKYYFRFSSWGVDQLGYSYISFFHDPYYDIDSIAIIDPDGNMIGKKSLGDLKNVSFGIDGQGNVFILGWFFNIINLSNTEVIPKNGNNCIIGCLKAYEIIYGTSIKEPDTYARIIITPNPSNGSLRISGKDLSKVNLISVYDQSGKLVYLISAENPHNEINLNLSFLQKGIYFMKLTSGNFQSVQKIVIN